MNYYAVGRQIAMVKAGASAAALARRMLRNAKEQAHILQTLRPTKAFGKQLQAAGPGFLSMSRDIAKQVAQPIPADTDPVFKALNSLIRRGATAKLAVRNPARLSGDVTGKSVVRDAMGKLLNSRAGNWLMKKVMPT